MIGQTYAKKVLSVATYNHYKRLRHNLKMKSDQNSQSSETGVAANGGKGGEVLPEPSVDLRNSSQQSFEFHHSPNQPNTGQYIFAPKG